MIMRTWLVLLSAGSASSFRIYSRRTALSLGSASVAAFSAASPSVAYSLQVSPKPPTQSSAALDELPPNTAIAYQRQWPAMQLGADFYTFELLERVKSPNRWDLIGAFAGLGGDSSASRLEREFLTPMTILALAFPPDAGGDEMQSALQAFRKAMGHLARVAGSSPGITEGPTSEVRAVALGHWDDGRMALNSFLVALNSATETDRLTTIPANGLGYPRSRERYVQLQKDSALCRNRASAGLDLRRPRRDFAAALPCLSPCLLTQSTDGHLSAQVAERPLRASGAI